MPHPWKHSRSGWTGLWATWSNGRSSRSLQRGWTRWPSKVPSNPNHSMILWSPKSESLLFVAVQSADHVQCWRWLCPCSPALCRDAADQLREVTVTIATVWWYLEKGWQSLNPRGGEATPPSRIKCARDVGHLMRTAAARPWSLVAYLPASFSRRFLQLSQVTSLLLNTYLRPVCSVLMHATPSTEIFKLIRAGCQKHLQEEIFYFRGFSSATGLLFKRKRSNTTVLINLDFCNIKHLQTEYSQTPYEPKIVSHHFPIACPGFL